MNLPNVVTALIDAQNNYDSIAYANCFSETAIVFDEGETHTGKNEIKRWIEKANEAYKAVMEPLRFEETGTRSILTAKISGTFKGSPVVLKYDLEIKNGLIQRLSIS